MVDTRASEPASSPMVIRLARATVLATFALIVAGGLVTSRDAGLAVPDWPLSFGTLNPPRWLEIVNVRTEHGHRLVAGIVALLTIALAVVARVQRERPVVVRACTAAAGLVLFQALLGGLRVLQLSLDLAMVHALTGQLFLCIAVVAATLVSPTWRNVRAEPARAGERLEASILCFLVLSQLVLGIVIRHIGSDEKPLIQNGVLHAHVVLALSIVAFAVRQRGIDLAHGRSAAAERFAQILRLVVVQIGLGVAALLVVEPVAPERQASALESWLPTLHVVTGACILAAAVRAAVCAYAHERAPVAIEVAAARAESSLG
jgi:cytochrome c oxidase assembly protein subunit 15